MCCITFHNVYKSVTSCCSVNQLLPFLNPQMFGTLKKEIDLSNKKRAQAMREREDFRKRCDQAEAGAVKALEESTTLKQQVSVKTHDKDGDLVQS